MFCVGQNCEIDIDDCANVICDNDGKCKDMVNNFTCECHPGFRGQFCTENIDECEPQPCKNGGSCKDGIASYTCQCTKEWTGKQLNFVDRLK